MSHRELVNGLPTIEFQQIVCDTCVMAKQHRERIPRKSHSRATRPLQLIHTDLCGPFAISSIHGARYLLTFIDDHSRFTWVYFLRSKDETFCKFKEFRAMIEKELGHNISCLHSDRGGEYLSTEFKHFCDQFGIQRQLTLARTPQQNGVAERKNLTLLEAARSLQISGDVPLFL
ncbi:unnamed protein product [Calypogeia fissa]